MGLATTPLAGWYQAAKHALEAVSDALRVEVAGDGVQVASSSPAGSAPSIWDDMDRDIEESRRFTVRRPPIAAASRA